MVDFEGRRVLITGGTGALGSTVVERLLGAGASCVVPWLVQEEKAAFAHTDNPAVALIGPFDLAAEPAVETLFAGAGDLWASVHIAGGFDMAPIAETSAEQFDAMMRMNALSCFLCCREAVRNMAERGGRIVNVAARPALRPEQGAGMVAYTVSKSAVAALTGALAAEVAGNHILVNAIAPSIMSTPANRAAMPDADHDAWPTCDQVADTICYLASPQNAVTSGVVVPVYGCA